MEKLKANLKLIMCAFCIVVFVWLVQVTRYEYNVTVFRASHARIDRLTGKIQTYSFEHKAWSVVSKR